MRVRKFSDAPVVDALTSERGTTGTASLILLACAALALSAGVLVYVLDRNGPQVLPLAGLAASSATPTFGVIGRWLPSFVHPFAFSLLSAAARPAAARASAARPAWGACVAWWLVNVLFEAGQHPALRTTLAQFIDRSFADAAPARWLANYFTLGTFDPFDIVAATAGAGAAAGVLWLVHKRELASPR